MVVGEKAFAREAAQLGAHVELVVFTHVTQRVPLPFDSDEGGVEPVALAVDDLVTLNPGLAADRHPVPVASLLHQPVLIQPIQA